MPKTTGNYIKIGTHEQRSKLVNVLFERTNVEIKNSKICVSVVVGRGGYKYIDISICV